MIDIIQVADGADGLLIVAKDFMRNSIILKLL